VGHVGEAQPFPDLLAVPEQILHLGCGLFGSHHGLLNLVLLRRQLLCALADLAFLQLQFRQLNDLVGIGFIPALRFTLQRHQCLVDHL
jgi:hypothetical protein